MHERGQAEALEGQRCHHDSAEWGAATGQAELVCEWDVAVGTASQCHLGKGCH